MTMAGELTACMHVEEEPPLSVSRIVLKCDSIIQNAFIHWLTASFVRKITICFGDMETIKMQISFRSIFTLIFIFIYIINLKKWINLG